MLACALIFVDPVRAAEPVDPADDDAENALLAVPSTDATRPRGATETTASLGEKPAGAAAFSAASDPDTSWAIPPIPWRARLGIDIDRFATQGSTSSGATTTNLSASASSFVFAPWFVRLTGASNFGISRSTGGGEGSSASGDLSAAILPQSRFPAGLSLSAGTSTQSSSAGSTTVEFRRLGYNQSYTPPDNSVFSNFTYDLSQAGVKGGGMSTSEALKGSGQFRVQGEIPQTLLVSGAVRNSRSDMSSAGSENQSLTANHSMYFEDYVLNIASDVLLDRTAVTGEGAGESLQFAIGTTADWIPSDDYPLRLLGSGRHQVFRALGPSGALTSELSSSNVALSAAYPLSQQWTFAGNAFITRTESNDNSVTAYTLTGSAAWGGGSIQRDFDPWRYRLNYQSSVSGERFGFSGSGDSPAVTSGAVTVNAGVGQSLGRTFLSAPNQGQATLDLTQRLDLIDRFYYQASRTAQLGHAATFAWAAVPSPSSTLAASLSASDGRSFGASRSQYQSLNGSVSGSRQLNARESWSWSALASLSRQSSSGSGGDVIGALGGGAGYNNARFANVTGLLYSANYSANLRPNQSVGGQYPSSNWLMDHRFSQSWSWRLGLLSWKMTNDVVRTERGDLLTSLRLSISRDFGGVL